MNPFAMYSLGGLFSVTLLFFGMYQMSNVVGNVSYEKGDGAQAATVVVTSVPSLDDRDRNTGPSFEPIHEAPEEAEEEVVEKKNASEEEEEELIAAVSEAPIGATPPSPQPSVIENEQSESALVDTSAQQDTIAELQEQVSSLLDQVADATESEPEGTSEPAYFVTPSGVRLDASGNVIHDNGEVVDEEEEEPVVAEQETESETLPYGYYRLPSGVIMGPGGVVVDEEDLADAEEEQEQAFQTQSTGCFTLPNGNTINAYGQPCD
jgi:hypothetical protein